MLEKLQHLVDAGAIPFLMGAVSSGGSPRGPGKPNITRIVEAVIIAILSAGATILVLQKDVQYLKEAAGKTDLRLERFMEKQENINRDLYKQIYGHK